MDFSKDIFKASKIIGNGMFDEIIRICDGYHADERIGGSEDPGGEELKELKRMAKRARQFCQAVFEDLRDGNLDGCIEDLENLIKNIDALMKKLKDEHPNWDKGYELIGTRIYFTTILSAVQDFAKAINTMPYKYLK